MLNQMISSLIDNPIYINDKKLIETRTRCIKGFIPPWISSMSVMIFSTIIYLLIYYWFTKNFLVLKGDDSNILILLYMYVLMASITIGLGKRSDWFIEIEEDLKQDRFHDFKNKYILSEQIVKGKFLNVFIPYIKALLVIFPFQLAIGYYIKLEIIDIILIFTLFSSLILIFIPIEISKSINKSEIINQKSKRNNSKSLRQTIFHCLLTTPAILISGIVVSMTLFNKGNNCLTPQQKAGLYAIAFGILIIDLFFLWKNTIFLADQTFSNLELKPSKD